MKLEDLPLMWDVSAVGMNELALDHIDRERLNVTLSQAKLIAADLAAVHASVAAQPHRDPAIDREIIRRAEAAAQAKLEPLVRTVDTLKRETAETATLPASATSGVDPATVAAIRGRLATMDPVGVYAEFRAAADTGDRETLEAISSAHPVAFPTIHAMLAANPQAREQVALTIRTAHNPEATKVHTHKAELAESLGAIVGDLQRAVGAPDEIARMAAGT